MSDREGAEPASAVASQNAVAAPDRSAASRPPALAAFLGSCGWGGQPPVPLAADASFRRYYRVRHGRRRAVVMDAPPPQEDVAAFAAISRVLRDLGLSAPRVLYEDRARGFLLLEDFGDETYARLLADGADEPALYALAVDALVALQRAVGAGDLPDLPAYDEALLLAEAVLLVDWYLPAVLGAPLARGLREEYLELWRPVLTEALAPFKPTLVLRDFHIDNLVYLRRRVGVRRCGLLDFQDAVCGPPGYDLVSLTADARRDVSEALAAAMTARYLAAFPRLDRPAFVDATAVFAAQRNCKVIGIFTRLWRRDRKPGYLSHIPRLWRLVERDLRHPSLAPIMHWLDRHLPSAARRVPDTGLPS
jgi:aminoglycoside/choline kinase family phosphotransferase